MPFYHVLLGKKMTLAHHKMRNKTKCSFSFELIFLLNAFVFPPFLKMCAHMVEVWRPIRLWRRLWWTSNLPTSLLSHRPVPVSGWQLYLPRFHLWQSPWLSWRLGWRRCSLQYETKKTALIFTPFRVETLTESLNRSDSPRLWNKLDTA